MDRSIMKCVFVVLLCFCTTLGKLNEKKERTDAFKLDSSVSRSLLPSISDVQEATALDPVTNLNVSPDENSENAAKVTFSCPPNAKGNINYFVITYKALTNTDTLSKCQKINPYEDMSGIKVPFNQTSCMSPKVVPVTADTKYFFMVAALNNNNRSSANITYFAMAGASESVNNLTVSQISSTKAKVQWSPPVHSRGNIFAYEVSVRSTEGCGRIQVRCKGNQDQDNYNQVSSECKLYNGNSRANFTDNQVSYDLTGLKPYTDYNVDVLVINNYGKGANKSTHFQTLESAPERVQNLKVWPVKDNSSEANITFGCPLTPNGKIANFWITYQALNNTNTTTKCQNIKPIENRSGIKVQFEESKACSYLVNVQVTADTQYDFTVFAANKFNGSSEVIKYVAKAGASDPVVGLKFTGVTSAQATVLWSPPLHPRGNILGYELRWTSNEGCRIIQLNCMSNQDDDAQDLKKDNQVSSECKQFNGNPVATFTDKQVTYDLTGLKPYTFYSIDVLVINNKGKSAKSSNTFKTSNSEPGKVGNLRVTPLTLNYTAVDVSFSSPQKPNGVIPKYILSYYMLSKGYTNPACEILTQITNWTDIAIQADSSNTGIYSKIVEVSPGTTYSFQVTAYNQLLGSPAVINYTTGSHVPGTIDDLHIYNLTSDSVVVTWKPPAQPNGFLLGYRLQLNRLQSQVDECYTAAELSCSGEKISDIPTEAWCDTDRIANVKVKVSNPLSYQFTGLLPYTRYELLAVAVNKQGSGISSSVNFSSSESGLLPYSRYELIAVAVNKQGSGESSSVFFNSTPGPVTSLKFSSVSGDYSSLILQFTCLEKDERHGKITHYVIKYTTNTETSDSKCGMSAVIQNSSGITMDDDGACNFSRRVHVTPERHYNFTVQAYSSVPGTIASFEAFTPFGSPGPVTELKSRAITNSSVTVQWSTPEVVNGMIHSYQLSIELPDRCIFRYLTTCGDFDVKQEDRKPEKECKDTDIKPTVDKIKHNVDLHYITVNDLLSYTNYTVSVVPTNSNGSGPEAHIDFRTDIGLPDEPNGFHATKNNASTITLFWSPSKHHAGPTHYIIGVYGNVDHITNNCSKVKELHVQGFSTSSKVVTNLCSYTNYTFTIMASTSAGKSSNISADQIVRTGIGIPAAPQNIVVTSVSPFIVNLSWTPSKHQAGPTSYIIEVFGELDLGSGYYTSVQSLNVKGFSNTLLAVQDLLSYTNYKFTIRSSTTAGESATIDTAVRTQPPVPVTPQNIVATSISPFIVNLSWTPSKHQAGPTSYIIVVFGKLDQGSSHYTSVQSLNVTGFSNTSLTVQDLLSYTNYKFTIRSSTAAGESATIDTAVRTQPTVADPPRNLAVHNVTASLVRLSWVPSEHQCGLTDYIVGVEEQPHLQADFYTLSRTITVHGFHSNEVDIGNLTSYWKYRFFVRASTSVHPDLSSISVEQQTLQSAPGRVENIQVSALPNNYTAVKLTWECPEERKRHGPISHFTVQYSDKVYILGHFPDGEPCRKPQTEVHTAVLPVLPEQSYIFTVFATAKYDGMKTLSQSFYAEAGTKSNSAVVVGGVSIAIVAIVVGVVIGVFVYKRRRNRSSYFIQPQYTDDDPDEDETEESVDKTRPMKICDFPKLVDSYHKNSDLLFSKQWQEISQSSPIHPSHIASLEINRPKNSYVNILAYDHTRVKLLPQKTETGSNYINANFIPGSAGPKEYIASQGPVIGTVEDFWQMIWEQNVSTIVQLTGLYEKGKRMLAQYWPDDINERVAYGNMEVELLNESTINKCTMKTFKVNLGSETREVDHFYLLNWQNKNLKPEEIIDFAKRVRSELETNIKGPMMVHCSAGVGRTGTFICVDYFLRMIDKADLEDSIDIFSFVLKMRDCRPMMVQSVSQYIFVHDVVKEMIHTKMRRQTGLGCEAVYINEAFEEMDEEDSKNENGHDFHKHL